MKLLTRSALVLFALYGLVFALASAFLARAHAPLWSAVLFTLAFVALQFAAAPWLIQRIYSIDWDESEIPIVHREFVAALCRERGLPPLRLGIIHSATPNAFSFGRFRADARVVITRGLLDVLTVDEANAVLAHEVGHVAHYDFAVMTLAAAVPLLLYQMYVWGDRLKEVRSIAWLAYLAYFVSQFLVLTLNRTREFWADHFAAECTHAPNDLSSALVKIAYGMVAADGHLLETMQHGSAGDKKAARRQQQFGGALALMGISNLKSGASLALAMANPAQAAAVMQWDLVNPWARIYELGSTHPLTALRVKALNTAAASMHLPEGYPLPSATAPRLPLLRWPAFLLQFVIWAAPIVCIVLFFVSTVLGLFSAAGPWLLLTAGLTWTARILYRYHGRFVPQEVGSLLQDLEVSQMTPRAVELRGRIVGNGLPGAFWSPDLLLQDETGLMFVLYRASIPFARLLFAFRNAERFIGEDVVIRGWYRRGLRPYVEFSEIRATVTRHAPVSGSAPVSLFSESTLRASNSSTTEELHNRSWSRWIQLAGAAVLTVFAALWLLAGTAPV